MEICILEALTKSLKFQRVLGFWQVNHSEVYIKDFSKRVFQMVKAFHSLDQEPFKEQLLKECLQTENLKALAASVSQNPDSIENTFMLAILLEARNKETAKKLMREETPIQETLLEIKRKAREYKHCLMGPNTKEHG